MAIVIRRVYEVEPFTGLQEIQLRGNEDFVVQSGNNEGIEVLFHQAVHLTQWVAKTSNSTQLILSVQQPSGVSYAIRSFSSATHFVLNSLDTENPFFWAKLPAESRLRIYGNTTDPSGPFVLSVVVQSIS